MPQTDAQKRATARYVKNNVHTLSVRFFPKDKDLWEWIATQDNKQEYMRELVRQDMEKRRS